MTNALGPFRLGVAIIIDCLLISLLFGSIYAVTAYVQTSKSSLAKQQQEYEEGDILALSSKTISGADVTNIIRRYKKSVNFEVKTRNGSRIIGVNDPFVNDVNSNGYVQADSWFDCTITKNLNGVITNVSFSERGEPLDSSDVSDTTEMKCLIVSIIDNPAITEKSSWSDIQVFLENNLIDAETREALLNVVPGGADTDSWSDLVQTVINTISDLQSQQSVNSGGAQEIIKGTVSRNSSTELAKQPKALLVSTYGDEEYLLLEGVWYSVTSDGAQKAFVFGQWYTLQQADVSDKFALTGKTLSNFTSMAISFQYVMN